MLIKHVVSNKHHDLDANRNRANMQLIMHEHTISNTQGTLQKANRSLLRSDSALAHCALLPQCAIDLLSS